MAGLAGQEPPPPARPAAHLVEEGGEDLLVAADVDAAADPQQLLLVLRLGLREGLELDQQVHVLQVSGAGGVEWVELAAPTRLPSLDRRTDNPEQGPWHCQGAAWGEGPPLGAGGQGGTETTAEGSARLCEEGPGFCPSGREGGGADTH